jgi:hypothetical protein
MKSEQIADKRRIFELFTKILDVVAGYDEREVLRCMFTLEPCTS